MTIANAAPILPARSVPARAGMKPRMAQALMLGIAGASMVAGLVAVGGGASAHAVAQAGPDLTRLLRAMAGIKVVMAAVATAAVLWRLEWPVPAARFSGYALAVAGMAAGPGLIWGMVHVASGAFLLHSGLIGSVLLLWRDPEVARRLEVLVARKRAAIRGK